MHVEDNQPLAGDQPNPADNPVNDAPVTDTPAETDEAKAAREQAEAAEAVKQEQKKKNRTGAFIDKMKNDNHALRQELAELKAKVSQPASPAPGTPLEGEPTLEQHGFNIEAFTRAHSAWAVDRAVKEQQNAARQADTARKQSEAVQSYQSRIDTFTEEHPDFYEKVGTLPALPMDVQAAIMGHELGPQIAYHLAQNRKELLDLARTPEGLYADAVEDLASRLKPAPQAAAQTQTRAISQAPAPTPTVSARSPLNTPEDKLTDDEWLDRQRQAKRDRRR